MNRLNHKQNPQNPRMFDQLESIYNQQASYNKNQHKLHQRLYYKVVQEEQRRKQQKSQFEKSLNKKQNQSIDLFWKLRQEQLRQQQMKRKSMIEQTRKVNNQIFSNKVLSKSMVMSQSIPLKNQYQEGLEKYQQKLLQDKRQKKDFLKEAQDIKNYKQMQERLQKQRQRSVEKQKIKQNQQQNKKREQFFQNWKKQYLQEHNTKAFQVWQKANLNKAYQEEALQNYIVNEGARQLNERVYQIKNQVHQRQKAKRDQYIRSLQSQLQHNQLRTASDRQNQMTYERQRMDERNKYLQERDQYIKKIKQQEHKKHLQVLRNQIKPRNLLPQKDKLEYAGIGSPVHIGKVVSDDRRKQLQWLEKNLYKELSL